MEFWAIFNCGLYIIVGILIGTFITLWLIITVQQRIDKYILKKNNPARNAG